MSNRSRSPRHSSLFRSAALPLVLLLMSRPGAAKVVINEVFYHAPDDRTEVQFVELFNDSEKAADLAGWKLAKGVRFTFPAGATIEPGGYLVVCKDREAYQSIYQAAPAGVFEGSLGRGGDEIELQDSQGKTVEAVKYQDRSPWPSAPDGHSSSLERISPRAPSGLPHNWAPSPQSEDGTKPGGTPGAQNASFSENLPPSIDELRLTPDSPQPGEAISVEAKVSDDDGVSEVRLAYRLATSGQITDETTVSMTAGAGGRFTGQIPGQEAGRIVRLRVQAVDRSGAMRWHPSPHEPRPAVSRYVPAKADLAKIPGAIILNLEKGEFEAARRNRRPSRGPFGDPAERQRMMATMMVRWGADLEGAWWDLVMKVGVDSAQIVKLKSIFSQKIAERQVMIDDLGNAEDIEARMASVPQSLQAFHEGVKKAVEPALGDDQKKKFAELQKDAALQPGDFNWGPDRMVRQLFDLEGLAYALFSRAKVTESQIEKVKAPLAEAAAERAKLAKLAERAMQAQAEGGGFAEIQEKLGALNEATDKKIGAELNSEQQRELTRWKGETSGPPWARAQRKRSSPAQGRHAFVFIDPASGKHTLFDFIRVSPRGGGYKVRFHGDQPLNGMTTINLLFEYMERFVLAEGLAYDVYRRAGNAACLTDFVRLYVDGRLLGYHLVVEQPNRSFLRRNKLRDDGNLYKILWYERGVVGQHEKKTNVHGGHDDVVELVELLKRTKGDEQWAAIKKHFDVEQVATYFAVNMVLSHWDGFFNNYFTYHDTHGTGKWTMYPWDQDKTWGFYDGLQRGQVFYDMPITFGMEGDKPAGGGGRSRRGGPFGGTAWWRPGGYFSAPLLANATFRKLFLARVKDILEKVYTQEALFPGLDEVEAKLRPEIAVRAKALGEDPDRSLSSFEADIRSLREHVLKRREFLLAQEEVRSAGAFDREALK